MRPQQSSQLGVVSWGIPAQTPADLARRVGELGLAKVQIDLLHVHQNAPAWSDVGPVLRDRGIRIVSGMWNVRGGSLHEELWPENLRRTRAAAQTAQKLGLKLVSSHVGHIPNSPDDPNYPRWIERVCQLAHILADHGCVLLFETGQESAQGLWRFLQALDAAGVQGAGVNFDPANMFIHHTDEPIPSLRTLVSRVKQCHLKDARRAEPGQKRGVEVQVGRGDVDWPAFFAILAEADFTGDLILERECGDNQIADVRQAIADVSALMRG